MKPSYFKTQPKEIEKLFSSVGFKIHKFNNRRKDVEVVIICCFSEFGCETIGSLYIIPKLIKQFVGKYVIVCGWLGRAFLYKHLVDEFWELDEKYMSLRDKTYAFHHSSKNLTAIEKALTQYGQVIKSADLGNFVIGNYCRTCGNVWQDSIERKDNCDKCRSTAIVHSILTNVKNTKKQVCLPKINLELTKWAKEITGDNAVVVFARNRKTYGRNLSYEFYVNLCNYLIDKGYKVIWMGEKTASHQAPPNTLDLIGLNSLEKVLAIIKNARLTIQYFTASSRLAGMVGTPFILFENPECFYPVNYFHKQAGGQEGKRLELCTFGKRKIVACDFHLLSLNESVGITLLDKAITELMSGNEEDIIGLVPDPTLVKEMQVAYAKSIS